MRISPSPTTAGLKKPKKRGGNMEKDCGGRPRFVSFFLFQFAFCPFMQYLCNGKRSTCVLLFYALKVPTPPKGTFHPTLRGVIRPEWPSGKRNLETPNLRTPTPLKGAYIPANSWMVKPPLGGWGSVDWGSVIGGSLGPFTQSPPVRPLRARPVPASRRWQSPCRSFRPRCCFASSWPRAPPRCRRHSPRRPRPR